MTEDPREPGRIDLCALDEAVDPTQAERVIDAALARVALGAGATTASENRGAQAAPFLAVATTALLLLAGLLLFMPRSRSVDDASSLIDDWSASGHIPTNGELLAAFGGHRP